jgi:hypothetical protein
MNQDHEPFYGRENIIGLSQPIPFAAAPDKKSDSLTSLRTARSLGPVSDRPY